MSHGINAYYQSRFNTAHAVQPRANVRAAPETAAAQHAAPAQASRSAAGAAPSGLSTAERQMIDRYFPPSETMTLRLYGPGHGTRTLDPGSIGSRLDLQG